MRQNLTSPIETPGNRRLISRPAGEEIFAALGPRPRLTFVICEQQVAEIWVNGRAPLISLRDYNSGICDPMACHDHDGFAYTRTDWQAPAWRLGLTLGSQI